MKKIKLMADYHCFPLWCASPGEIGNINPDELPISIELKNRLYKWANLFDETLDMDNPINSGFSNVDDKIFFKKEAYEIAKLLKDELGPKYDIIVHV